VTGMIQLTGVSKSFEGRREVTALAGVDLQIARGEMISIIGPSGSGKSTLLNLMGALDTPTQGEVAIDGQALSTLDDRARTLVRRDKIGFIFQFFNLLPSLSALENVALPLHLRRWPRAKTHERARELLALVGLEKRVDHLPDELSGGERQRVAIARALSNYPPILLGDEPTGNLDTRTGAEILELMRDLHARLGATVVIVTHDMQVAASCSRVVRMVDGRIAEDRRS
jgi:putative ABC transport system ATP-binding protein